MSSSALADGGSENDRPVLGVFSQATDTITDSDTIAPTVEDELSGYRYMTPASYVTGIGQAGGRVLPILLDPPSDYYEDVFSKVSGVLFPGGATRASIPPTCTPRRGAVVAAGEAVRPCRVFPARGMIARRVTRGES